MHLVTGAFLYIYKGLLTASGLLSIKFYLQLTIKNIESLLHIGMNMGSSNLTCFEFSYRYLCERATGLIAGKKNTFLPYTMRSSDGSYVC
jgi:hypothetical protein